MSLDLHLRFINHSFEVLVDLLLLARQVIDNVLESESLVAQILVLGLAGVICRLDVLDVSGELINLLLIFQHVLLDC